MRLSSLPQKIKYFAVAWYQYCKKTGESKNKSNSLRQKKVIVIQMSKSHIYSRFFYTLIKFFSLAGYTIYFPNFSFKYFLKHFYLKNQNDYYKLLFDDDILIFSPPPKNIAIHLTLTDANLNPDYFTPLLSNKHNSNSFFIPMTMHPNLYFSEIWNKKLNTKVIKRKSIFMAGNLDSEMYKSFETSLFHMENRIEIYNFLEEKRILKKFNSNQELSTFLENPDDYSCVLVDSKKNRIKSIELRDILNRFSFFLALPGVVKPLCHNLIEALSTNTIPIIDEAYASILVPKLEHMHTAIIYNGLNDLESKINFAYNLNDLQLNLIRNNIANYYESNLTPEAVVNNILKKNYDTMYLQTVQICVKLFSKSQNLLSS